MIDRPPNVSVLRALTGDCIFRSVKNNPQGGDKKDEKYWNRHQQEKMHCASLTTHNSQVFLEMIAKVPSGAGRVMQDMMHTRTTG